MSTERARLVAGRYELREQLGSAEGHAVWHAYDPQSGEDVVVKQPLPEHLADDRVRRRLQAEAEAVGRLDHPNIVPLREAHFTAHDAALVFPLIAGRTLAERLADGAPLSPLEVARIGAALASALDHAHAAGIAHRDVKPANILLGDDGQPRLLDFGIAATPDPATSEADGAATSGGRGAATPGMVVGTLPYMAPEQLTGAPAHPAGDVYALSVVLYEMLAGVRPYQAVSPQTLVDEQRRPPEPIDGAPPALTALVLAGLDPDPTARPSAAEISSRLAAWSAHLPDDATVAMRAAGPPTATLVAVRSRSEPRQRGLGAVLLAGSVLLLGVAVSSAFFLGLPSEAVAPTQGADALAAPTDAVRTPDEAPAVTVDQPDDEDRPQAGSGGSGGGDRDNDKAKGKGKGKGKGKRP